MNRCIDPNVGVKVLSYDLLPESEKAEMDAHLLACAACRDFRQQTLGKEGLLDELAQRVFRLSRRHRVEPHAWMAERFRDLWIPLMLIAVVIGGLVLLLTKRPPEAPRIGIVRLAVSHGGSIDSATADFVPHVEPAPASVIVRTDRAARAYLYELHDGSLRRIIPGGQATPPEVSEAGTKEILLPPLEAPDSRVLLVLVPREASGTLDEWDQSVFRHLGGKRAGESVPAGGPWPNGSRPTLRWLP